MTLNELQVLATDSVYNILSKYFNEPNYANIIRNVCEINPMLGLWASDNNVDPSTIIDAIELSLASKNRLDICNQDEDGWIASVLHLNGGINITLIWTID